MKCPSCGTVMVCERAAFALAVLAAVVGFGLGLIVAGAVVLP